MAGSNGLISVKDLVSAKWRNRHPNISEEGLIGYIQVERPGYNYLRGGAENAGEKENDNVRDGNAEAAWLKKTDSYWLVHKNCFDTILVNGKMRIVIDSFEKW